MKKPLNSEPVFQNYTIWKRVKDIMLNLPYRLVKLWHLPGFVRDIEIPDRVTGDFIRIKVGTRHTIITVNNRDYYFDRISGDFAGTGYTLRGNTIEEQLYCILGHIRESTDPP